MHNTCILQQESTFTLQKEESDCSMDEKEESKNLVSQYVTPKLKQPSKNLSRTASAKSVLTTKINKIDRQNAQQRFMTSQCKSQSNLKIRAFSVYKDG